MSHASAYVIAIKGLSYAAGDHNVKRSSSYPSAPVRQGAFPELLWLMLMIGILALGAQGSDAMADVRLLEDIYRRHVEGR